MTVAALRRELEAAEERQTRARGKRAASVPRSVASLHHLRCIHGGYLTVRGAAPDGLTWFLNGREWDGRASVT